MPPFAAAAHDAARRRARRVNPKGSNRRRPPPDAAPAGAFAPQMIGQLVGRDAEQVAFQRPLAIEVGQAGQKTDERLLDDIFAGGPIVQATFDKRQQASFEADNQIAPGGCIGATNPLDQQSVELARFRHRRKWQFARLVFWPPDSIVHDRRPHWAEFLPDRQRRSRRGFQIGRRVATSVAGGLCPGSGS